MTEIYIETLYSTSSPLYWRCTTAIWGNNAWGEIRLRWRFPPLEKFNAPKSGCP